MRARAIFDVQGILFLLLIVISASDVSNDIMPSVRFVSPANGVLVDRPWIDVQYKVDGFRVPDDGTIRFHGGKLDGEIDFPGNTMTVKDLEPGTHLFTAQLMHRASNETDQTTMLGEPALLHLEAILSESQIKTQRIRPGIPTAMVALPRALKTRRRDLTICFSSTASQFDGQKKIWLDLVRSLRHSTTTNYSFEFKLFEPEIHSVTHDKLRALGVPIHNVPLTIDAVDAARFHITPGNFQSKLLLHVPDNTTDMPPYAAHVWHLLAQSLSTCHVLLFANARNIGDQVLVHGARHAGVRAIVMELANVYPVPVDVDVILGPSHYTIFHDSVTAIATTDDGRHRRRHVVPPGVNLTQFRPSPPTFRPSNSTCIVVGYVGRLAVEKSLGLLLSAMALVQHTYPCVHLRVVGDGGERAALEAIARDLSLHVTFVGGIYDVDALVRELQAMHIFANPAAQEPFCIANVEAMAVGLPLVTFGTAGVSEYAVAGVNAVFADTMTPRAFADAIAMLIARPRLRRRMGMWKRMDRPTCVDTGRAARATAERRFNWDDTAAAYDELFGRLGSG
ncbi:Aste57867_10570 [Aphanomyces stellatus]|uniref:Aste57867_10570 protein n=1 Tax=Aphanomyces stellatus TaxID=120398 RepID=A0A485KR56_9STRA|nr:hypothetical protein As57867_010530 [Aphanomyces stellatus]VFT87443.1 Aste57867_10570 [Aphanomyces stellatus]